MAGEVSVPRELLEALVTRNVEDAHAALGKIRELLRPPAQTYLLVYEVTWQPSHDDEEAPLDIDHTWPTCKDARAKRIELVTLGQWGQPMMGEIISHLHRNE